MVEIEIRLGDIEHAAIAVSLSVIAQRSPASACPVRIAGGASLRLIATSGAAGSLPAPRVAGIEYESAAISIAAVASISQGLARKVAAWPLHPFE
ncbi:hypothetical protein [Sphingomonas melonis]|uniref:hypothetical protein n=1 Tax=Sphingomonas melonis TaxID=152682 RepID=UPI0012EA2A1D|nr:hypothetical protein [Sphingomonas melonis]